MHIKLSEKEQKLLSMLTMIPPSFEAAAQLLAAEKFTTDEVTRVAIEYSDECFCEVDDFESENNIPRPKGVVPNLHSTYIVDVIRFLLQYGLDPNGIHEDCNIMDSLHYVDNEFLAADALALLLEHGGNHDLIVDGEELFSSTDTLNVVASIEISFNVGHVLSGTISVIIYYSGFTATIIAYFSACYQLFLQFIINIFYITSFALFL